jgi:hypothetical protein
MAENKLDYRAINVLGATFRFRIKKLETEFMFADGSVHIFPNWDVKNLRERYYMEEYINVPTEMYLTIAAESGETVEYGIKTSDVKRFIELRAEFFEDLLLAAAGNMPLDSEENL